MKLPATAVRPIYRSDASGDTYAFTSYLSRVSPMWKSKVGVSTSVSWPTGSGEAKNSGVASAVQTTPGAVGYVAIGSAVGAKLTYAHVQNRRRRVPVRPSRSRSPRPGRRRTSGRDNSRVDRRPARVGEDRVPDLDVHVRARAAGLVEARDAEAVPALRGRRRAVVRRQLSFAPLPLSVSRRRDRTVRCAACSRRQSGRGDSARSARAAARQARRSARRARAATDQLPSPLGPAGSSAPRCRGRARPARGRSRARRATRSASSISPQCGSRGSRPVARARAACSDSPPADARCRCRACPCRRPSCSRWFASACGLRARPREAQLQHDHARAGRARRAAAYDRRRDHAEVLGDQRQLAELALDRVEELGARARAASARASRVRVPRRDRPVGDEAAEVVDAREVDELERAPEALDPPAVAGRAVRGPVVERVAPELAVRAERVGRRAGDLAVREELRLAP